MITQGKDVYEAFYKKNLAKRLLLGKSREPVAGQEQRHKSSDLNTPVSP